MVVHVVGLFLHHLGDGERQHLPGVRDDAHGLGGVAVRGEPPDAGNVSRARVREAVLFFAEGHQERHGLVPVGGRALHPDARQRLAVHHAQLQVVVRDEEQRGRLRVRVRVRVRGPRVRGRVGRRAFSFSFALFSRRRGDKRRGGGSRVPPRRLAPERDVAHLEHVHAVLRGAPLDVVPRDATLGAHGRQLDRLAVRRRAKRQAHAGCLFGVRPVLADEIKSARGVRAVPRLVHGTEQAEQRHTAGFVRGRRVRARGVVAAAHASHRIRREPHGLRLDQSLGVQRLELAAARADDDAQAVAAVRHARRRGARFRAFLRQVDVSHDAFREEVPGPDAAVRAGEAQHRVGGVRGERHRRLHRAARK